MLIVVTERVTELIVSSKIFEPLRNIIKRWAYKSSEPPPDTLYQHFKVMIDYLVTCGYCVSVWMGAFFALFAEKNFENRVENWFISALFLHGMSNIYHVCFELLKRGRVGTYDIMLKIQKDTDLKDGEQ